MSRRELNDEDRGAWESYFFGRGFLIGAGAGILGMLALGRAIGLY